jgi:Flp pilus assembly protein TadD
VTVKWRLTYRLLLAVTLLGALSACGALGLDRGFSADAGIEARLLQADTVQPPVVEPLALSQSIIDYMEAHIQPGLRGWDLVDRLQTLLFDEQFLNIQYRENATLTAIETFEQGYANCLSLVNLYVAMARHYGLDAQYQTVQVQPRWNRRGELVVLSEHINALGRLSASRNYIVDFTPDVRLQQRSARVVSDEHALGLYFNNIGVEALIGGDADSALDYFRYALLTDDSLAIAWNNFGSAWNQLGEAEFAEYSYRKAYALDRRNTTALNNLARHYSRAGKPELAERYRRVLDRVHNANPYYHFVRGSYAYELGNYAEARQHFLRALRRESSEPDFYFALGMTYERLGQQEEADELRQFSLALAEYGDQSYRPTYQRARIIEDGRLRTILRDTDPGMSFTFQ